MLYICDVTSENYKQQINVCRHYIGSELAADLCHHILSECNDNEKIKNIAYFARVARNEVYNNNSNFNKLYRNKPVDYMVDEDGDKEYISFCLEFVARPPENRLDFTQKQHYQLFMKLGSTSKVAAALGIHQRSVRRSLNALKIRAKREYDRINKNK